jgi:hypothetical protein
MICPQHNMLLNDFEASELHTSNTKQKRTLLPSRSSRSNMQLAFAIGELLEVVLCKRQEEQVASKLQCRAASLKLMNFGLRFEPLTARHVRPPWAVHPCLVTLGFWRRRSVPMPALSPRAPASWRDLA